jgi:hypothetical protein
VQDEQTGRGDREAVFPEHRADFALLDGLFFRRQITLRLAA